MVECVLQAREGRLLQLAHPLAGELELTRERVRQLEKSALTRLQHALDHDATPLKRRRDLATSA